MKIIKTIFLTIDLAILIILLVLHLTAKSALEEIVSESVKSLVPESVTEKVETGNSWLQEIANNEKVKQYINENTKEELTSKWDSVKGDIKEYVEEFIEEQEENLDPNQQKLVEAVRFLTNAKLKYIILGLIGLTILLMMINLKSIYKWIKWASYSSAMSGISLLGICYYVKEVLLTFVETNNITLRVIQVPAFYLIIGGVIVRFIYGVFEIIRKIHKKEKEDPEEE